MCNKLRNYIPVESLGNRIIRKLVKQVIIIVNL